MEWLTENAVWLISLVTSVIGVAAVVATFTKNTWDNAIVDFFAKVVNVIGQNYGQTKNKDSDDN